jgi:hypothetical protein
MFEKYIEGKAFCRPQIQRKGGPMKYKVRGSRVTLLQRRLTSLSRLWRLIEALELCAPNSELPAAFRQFRKEEFA